MRKLLLPILFLHLAVVVNAATYYFSSQSGDDSRTSDEAQSSSTPWKTIDKLNLIMPTLEAGDQVLFKRGESFNGGMVITASGNSSASIYFGAYGSGVKPIITGFSFLSDWTQVKSNIWECPFWQPSGVENMVTKSGKQVAMGRYPNRGEANGGYLTLDSHVGLTQLTSKQLPSSPNWTGADVAIRKNRWVIDRSTILSHSGTTLNFVSGSDNSITDKYGFFIENSPNTLDSDGEWFYDKARNKMQMYFDNDNPTSYSLRGSTVEVLVTIAFQKYVTFENLIFQGANKYAFNLTNSDYIQINNCAINFTGINAVAGLSSYNFTLTKSKINDANNNGIDMSWNCSNAVIMNNNFKRTANIPGMNQNAHGAFQGINIRGDNNLISYNNFDSTGANAVHFEGDYSTVSYNYINVFGFIVDDCGGIYTGQGLGDNTQYNSKSITNNIVLNGIGATAGTDDATYIATQGIYLDDNTNHVTVTGNTVANCGQAGIFNHNATFTNLSGNTLYNNGKSQLMVVRSNNPTSNVTIRDNIAFSKTVSQQAMRAESYYGSNNISGIGDVDANYYCRPIDNNYVFYDMYLSGGQYYTSYDNLNTWRSKFGLDKNSKGAPATIPSFTASNLSEANMYTNGSFNSSVGDVGSYASNGDMSKVWVANKLDDGTLQVTSSSYPSTNNYMLTLPLNTSIVAGQSYQLTFSLQGGSGNAPLSVYIRQNSSPQIDLTVRTQIPISTSRQEIKLAFTATASSSSGALEFDVAAPNGAVWLDNVNLQKATITPTNLDDYIVFQVNPSTTPLKINLNGTYYDATGNTFSGNVTIPSYGSVVLFKTKGTTVNSLTAKSTESVSVDAKLVDASAVSSSGTSTADVNWTTENQSDEAAYYKVERSTDNSVFTSVGKVTAKTSTSTSVNYALNDATPAAGKNYYRVTEFNASDSKISSQIVTLNNISFKINPNPAKDVIHLLFDYPVSTTETVSRQASIQDMSGATVKAVQLPVTGSLRQADITVSELKPGTYIFTIQADGKAISKKFLKL